MAVTVVGVRHVIGDDEVRLLRDGVVAHAAMLAAIENARDEILLEMYWVGNDRVGRRFRDALTERARRGVRVCVIYDAVGSMGLPRAFWDGLRIAGGLVREYSPIAPWRRRFRFNRLRFRDHRKNLVVDAAHGFAGGINLGELWAPSSSGDLGWRDDAVELRGPSARHIRSAFYRVWTELGELARTDVSNIDRNDNNDDVDDVVVKADDATSRTPRRRRVHVLTNDVRVRPNRAIRRTYLYGLRHARESICIATAYFLPGPRFLHALRAAARRGVRVRLLVPERTDVRIVSLAATSLIERLLEDRVEVYAYTGRMMHSKTAVFDDRVALIGSHNLDAMSWRFNLECNVVVDDAGFASEMQKWFDEDCAGSRRITLRDLEARPLHVKLVAWLVAGFRDFL